MHEFQTRVKGVAWMNMQAHGASDSVKMSPLSFLRPPTAAAPVDNVQPSASC